jgi:hypothetical protein
VRISSEEMYIMPASCFGSNAKSISSPIKPPLPPPLTPTSAKTIVNENLLEKFIIDNPLIFRVCCFCISRRRKRVDTAASTAKCNGNGEANHADEILTIDQIEFTPSTIALDDVEE